METMYLLFLAGLVFAFVLIVCWIVLPLFLIGTKPILRELLVEAKRTNELLELRLPDLRRTRAPARQPSPSTTYPTSMRSEMRTGPIPSPTHCRHTRNASPSAAVESPHDSRTPRHRARQDRRGYRDRCRQQHRSAANVARRAQFGGPCNGR